MNCSPFSRIMSRSHSSLSEHDLQTLRSTFPSSSSDSISLFVPSRDDNPIPPNPRTARLFGSVAMQRPLTGYEPNAIVEISCTEVAPLHFASRMRSFCSVYNSGEDATSAPVSSEVDEKQSIERLASPLLIQKREASAIPARIYPSAGHSSMSRSSHIPSMGKLVATHAHKRKSSRDTRGIHEKHLTHEGTRDEQQYVKDFFKFRTEEAVQWEHEALSRLSEGGFHTLSPSNRCVISLHG